MIERESLVTIIAEQRQSPHFREAEKDLQHAIRVLGNAENDFRQEIDRANEIIARLNGIIEGQNAAIERQEETIKQQKEHIAFLTGERGVVRNWLLHMSRVLGIKALPR